MLGRQGSLGVLLAMSHDVAPVCIDATTLIHRVAQVATVHRSLTCGAGRLNDRPRRVIIQIHGWQRVS